MKEKLRIICFNEKDYSVINIVGVTRFQQNDLWSCRYSAMCSLDQLVNNNFYKNPDAFGFLEDNFSITHERRNNFLLHRTI